MKLNIATDRRASIIGALWMVAAMAGFAIEDSLLKTVSVKMPVGQMLFYFGMGGAFIFAIVARVNGEAIFPSEIISRVMGTRFFFEYFGRLFYVLALSLAPLSSATVILQATPIVVVAGAALLFGESVGWRRWTSIIIGLIGVIIIIGPGTDSFSIYSLFAVLGMIGFAGRDLASRAAPPSLATSILGLYGFVAVFLAGISYSIFAHETVTIPDQNIIFYLIGAMFFGVISYASLMKAMRSGEVSIVTPFRYTRLLFGIGLGVLWFGESIDTTIIFGSVLIVFSGLFILWRTKKRAR